MDKNAEQVYNLLQEDSRHGPSRGALADVHMATVDLTPGLEVDPRFQVAPVMDEERRAVWRRRVAGALQQAQRQGMAPCAEVLAVVREVLHPRVPWRRLLESHVRKVHGGASTWLPPNRRAIHRGLYLPGRRESALRAVVAIDTSGSTHCFLPTFLSELSSLLRTFARTEVTVLCCDTELAPPQILDPFQPLTAETLELRGGGGTDLRPPFAWAAERMPPDVLVYLTDGEGPAPKRPPPFPVLWVLTPSGIVPAPWGEVAVMDVDDADPGLLGPGAPVFGPPGMLPGRRPG
jgi:predicted metal-dependent peptidase